MERLRRVRRGRLDLLRRWFEAAREHLRPKLFEHGFLEVSEFITVFSTAAGGPAASRKEKVNGGERIEAACRTQVDVSEGVAHCRGHVNEGSPNRLEAASAQDTHGREGTAGASPLG